METKYFNSDIVVSDDYNIIAEYSALCVLVPDEKLRYATSKEAEFYDDINGEEILD